MARRPHPVSWQDSAQCRTRGVMVRGFLKLVRHRQNEIVVVQVAGDHATDRLCLVYRRRRGRIRTATTATATATELRHVELVRQHRTRMSRLRVGSDVGIRTGDEEVELLHELAPLGHQQHTTTLALHELEATRRAGAHEAGIPVGPRHGIGCSRFYALRQRAHVVTERCVPGTRGVEDRVQIEPHLLRLALHEEIEGGRRLHAQRTLATSHRRACADGLRIHAQFAKLVHQLLRSGRIDANAK